MKSLVNFINENILDKSGVGIEEKIRNWANDAFGSDINLKIKGNTISGKVYNIYYDNIEDIPDEINIKGLDFSTGWGRAPKGDHPNYDHIVKRLFNGDFKYKTLVLERDKMYKNMIVPCELVNHQDVGIQRPVGPIENLTIEMVSKNPKKSSITFEFARETFGMKELAELTVKGHLENLIIKDTDAGDEITKECRARLDDPEELSKYLNSIFKNFDDVRFVQTGTKRDVYENNDRHWKKL